MQRTPPLRRSAISEGAPLEVKVKKDWHERWFGVAFMLIFTGLFVSLLTWTITRPADEPKLSTATTNPSPAVSQLQPTQSETPSNAVAQSLIEQKKEEIRPSESHAPRTTPTVTFSNPILANPE